MELAAEQRQAQVAAVREAGEKRKLQSTIARVSFTA